MTLPLPYVLDDPALQGNFDQIALQFPLHTGNLRNVMGPVYNVRDYSGTDGVALQAAVDAAQATGGMVVIPAGGLTFSETITIDPQLSPTIALGLVIKGLGGFTPLTYTGSGTMFDLAGTSLSNTVPYVTFEDLRLIGPNTFASIPTGTTKGIKATYANVCTLNRVFIKGFGTGLELNDYCTGWKLYQTQITLCVTGIDHGGTGSGGFAMYGGQIDTNVLGVRVDGNFNHTHFSGVEFDTDSTYAGAAIMGSSSQGAMIIGGGTAGLSVSDCNFLAEATPVAGTGGTVRLEGGCARIAFNDCIFQGAIGGAGKESQTAINIVNASNVQIRGGRTVGHTTSSYIVATASSNVLIIDPSNAEATGVGRVTGTGSAEVVSLITQDGVLRVLAGVAAEDGNVIARQANALQVNNADDSANITMVYNGGKLNFSQPSTPTVTGSRGGNAALADLLTELAGLGLITDSSTA